MIMKSDDDDDYDDDNGDEDYDYDDNGDYKNDSCYRMVGDPPRGDERPQRDTALKVISIHLAEIKNWGRC